MELSGQYLDEAGYNAKLLVMIPNLSKRPYCSSRSCSWRAKAPDRDGPWVPCKWSALPKTPTLDIDLEAIRQGTTIPIDFLFLGSDQGSACRRAEKGGALS